MPYQNRKFDIPLVCMKACKFEFFSLIFLENAKWILNVQWQMEGVDIHLDVNVGKQLSALGHTLTMLTGTEQDDDTATVESDSDETDHTDGHRTSEVPNRVVCT